ncbi:T9SS type A sorting domain-containing protein [Flavobacterium antarcticum]|uniref:T9SS type A sorting domain-containing protein n=1 Tax=Flavobacterium antarcticum TaxID=271155 RepID=UPI0003B4E8A2|nr:T9SS type A sorting domain-containing protein [Flavobacterium antarcticum]
MTQKYFYSLLLTLFFAFGAVQAQEPKSTSSVAIENLNFYPNPVTNGKIYITSKNSAAKEISIYDVLGKLVLQTNLNVNNKEVNIGALNSGVYIIKIKEGDATATRKLIVK